MDIITIFCLFLMQCHCYVCESRAPCQKWGNGTLPTDHCHATDNDKKWKDLRISFRCKDLPASKRKHIQNNFGAISTTPSLQQRQLLVPQPLPQSGTTVIQPSVGRVLVASNVSQNQQEHLFIRAAENAVLQPLPHLGTIVNQPSVRRVPVASNVSQNQQSHPSIGAAQNAIQGVHLPKASAQGPTIKGKRFKRSGAAPKIYTPPSNAYNLHRSLLNNTTLHPAPSHVFQTAQVAPGSNIVASSVQARTPQRALNAPVLFHRIQARPASHLQVAPNKAVGTGQQWAIQCAQGLSGSLLQKSWQDALANVASQLGVSDYNTNPPHGQQSASTQSLYPSQLFAQARASHGSVPHSNNVPATAQMRHSNGVRLPNLNSGDGVVATQKPQALCLLNSKSSLTQIETSLNSVVAKPATKH